MTILSAIIILFFTSFKRHYTLSRKSVYRMNHKFYNNDMMKIASSPRLNGGRGSAGAHGSERRRAEGVGPSLALTEAMIHGARLLPALPTRSSHVVAVEPPC